MRSVHVVSENWQAQPITPGVAQLLMGPSFIAFRCCVVWGWCRPPRLQSRELPRCDADPAWVVTELFKDQPDLLDEFTRFLPDQTG